MKLERNQVVHFEFTLDELDALTTLVHFAAAGMAAVSASTREEIDTAVDNSAKSAKLLLACPFRPPRRQRVGELHVASSRRGVRIGPKRGSDPHPPVS